MNTRRITTKASATAFYIIAIAFIIVAFLLLGGGAWIKHGGMSMGMANWNWVQILVGSCIGFLLGIIVSRWRR